MDDNDKTRKNLERFVESENYLKARYKLHCNSNDSCISHCIEHFLSHPKDKKLSLACDKLHDRRCVDCQNIITSIDSLKSMINTLPQSHEKDVALWEIKNAEVKIMDWQKHILRGVQQSKARVDAFKLLGPTNAIWIRDYAQKINPSKVPSISSPFLFS